jgi:hypothetical protein
MAAATRRGVGWGLWFFAENEDFDEAKDEDYDGDLAEEESD